MNQAAPVDYDCVYSPTPQSDKWLALLAPRSALAMGEIDDTVARLIEQTGVTESRQTNIKGPLRQLHNGVYFFREDGVWRSLWVSGARAAVAGATARVSFADDHLGDAFYTYQDNWKAATPLLGTSTIGSGDFVRLKSQRGWGVVRSVTRTSFGHVADVEIGIQVQQFDVDDLEHIDGDPRDPYFWLRRGAAEGLDLARTLSWLKLELPLSDTLYSYAATKTVFKPYQFIPVLKMLNSSTGRVLVADEVGLGKTIEAGLIWTELAQRQPIRRALVVVPAALRVKWRQEMERRFMRQLNELTLDDVRDFIADLEADRDPELVGIISLERFRSASDELARLAELHPEFDLIIVDEAHSLRNQNTSSYHLGRLLTDLADHVVFLSATPLNLGTNDLFNLVNLLDEGGFPTADVFRGQLEPNKHLNEVARIMADPARRSSKAAIEALERVKETLDGRILARRPDYERLHAILSSGEAVGAAELARVKRLTAELNTLGAIFTRTRKVDVPDKKAQRVVEEVLVEWSAAERDMYEAIQEIVRERALNSSTPLGFAAQMPLRQACSSLPVARRRQLAKEGWTVDEDDDPVEDESFLTGSLGGIDISPVLAPLEVDSKLEALRSRLRLARRNGMPQALIFSFFRGTVEYLADALGDEFATGVLHGGIPTDERQGVIDGFRAGESDILIANQVGSEGLDFEFCNVLVNYDLPWNPMQVEQRIGRVDRFGQQHDKIFIFNMKTPGTIESDIFGRLYDRIGVFVDSIGDLEPILRGELSELNKVILDPRVSEVEKEREIDRFKVAVEQQRDNVRELESANGLLTSLSLLEVEGLGQDGPTHGRYVGAAELRSLLTELLFRTGGALDDTTVAGLATMRGSTELARRLRTLRATSGGTMHGIGKLGSDLRDGHPITVTFNPHYEGIGSVELITARHPIIRLAVAEFDERKDHLPRYGAVRVPGLPVGSRLVVAVDRVQARGGVKDSRELWLTAVDAQSGDVVSGVGDLIMKALAEGRLSNSSCALEEEDVAERLRQLQAFVAQRQRAERAVRSQENDALVEARIASEQRSIRIKIDRTGRRLQDEASKPVVSKIVRMYAAQLKNQQVALEEVEAKYERKRNLSLGVEHVAVLVATD